jgi:DNA-binding response OmpR family regulator
LSGGLGRFGKEKNVARGKILLVEDDAMVRDLLEKSLIASGYEVFKAADGIEGLVKVDGFRPDLLIVDMMMPRLDGMTFVRAIKGNAETKTIPVIFLTARSDPRSMIDGINVGAKYYVPKPFALDDLLSKIEKAI